MTWVGGTTGYATMEQLPATYDKSGKPIAWFLCTYPLGKGISSNNDSALARPYHKILTKGAPMGTVAPIFYKEDENYFVLGTFVQSDKKKILFFPGLIHRRVTISPKGEVLLRNGILHHVDHYTLEPDLRTFHITLEEKETKKIRYEKRNTKRVKDDMIFWFAISIQRANRLEAAPKAQEIELVCYNKKDYTRRSQIIMNSRGGSTFNVVEVKDDSSEPYFVNFEFFVSQRQSKDYEPPEENFTTVSAPVTQVIDNREAGT